jgi:hypothetical protein
VEILIGLVLAAGVLWAWLAGHWFGRVLAFIVFAAVLAAIVGGLISGSLDQINPFGAIIGAVAAWFVSGIPIYCQRHKARSMTRRGFQLLHPDWTPRQIEQEIGLYRR